MRTAQAWLDWSGLCLMMIIGSKTLSPARFAIVGVLGHAVHDRLVGRELRLPRRRGRWLLRAVRRRLLHLHHEDAVVVGGVFHLCLATVPGDVLEEEKIKFIIVYLIEKH